MKLNKKNTQYLDLRIFCDKNDSKDLVTHLSLKFGESKESLKEFETSHFGDPYDKGEDGRQMMLEELQKLLENFFDFDEE